jgi:hypothetical protein
MFTAQQYRAKADEYAALLQTARSPAEVSEYRDLQRSFASLAENLEWMTANATRRLSSLTDDPDKAVPDPELRRIDESNILRCLGAAMMLNWNVIPAKLQRSLFEDAITMLAEEASVSKRVLAQYLHDHKNDAQGLFQQRNGPHTLPEPAGHE